MSYVPYLSDHLLSQLSLILIPVSTSSQPLTENCMKVLRIHCFCFRPVSSVQWFLCLGPVHFLLPLRFSLTFICLCLWIIRSWLSLRISLTFICLSRDYPFCISSSVLSNVYLPVSLD